jgi:uncharacterized membrane protein YphA (DoxX/SURF4 family)
MAEKKNPGLLLNISRYIAGTVFVYSGFVKGIDPLGSAYKFTDYFVAFNLEFLEPVALWLSFLLATAEMLIGIMLLGGIHMIVASWATLLFMAFFTILTFFIALTDPVSDCGCFGDAIILTNWETFWKNIFLMIFVIYLFIRRKRFSMLFSKRIFEWAAVATFVTAILIIFSYSYLNLPVLDYRHFHVGANIEEKMSVPPDAPADEYEIILYYKRDGEVRAFSIDEIPDSSWEWVRTESNLISRGYEPPITNFHIESVEEGIDYTWDILNNDGYTFILVAYDLDKSSPGSTGRINQLADWSAERDITFIGLTASPAQQIEKFIKETDAGYEFYHTDGITLKTMIRSNPGLLLLKEGTILGKWHYRNIPHTDELRDNLLSWSLEIKEDANHRLVSLGYILALFVILALLRVIRQSAEKNCPGENSLTIKGSHREKKKNH